MKNINFQSYAIALFDLNNDMQGKEEYYQQVLKLGEIINTNPELAKVLSAINISKDERKTIVWDLFREFEFEKTFIYWVWTIIDNNDFISYNSIINECRKLHHFLFNITKVKVITAHDLNKSQLQKIIDFFQKKLNTQIDLKVVVQPDLIGGLTIQVNNKTYNNTIKNKLKNLKEKLISKRG